MRDMRAYYRSCSMASLLEAQTSIDADQYPDNAFALQAEIQRRHDGGTRELAESEKNPTTRRLEKQEKNRFPLAVRLWGFVIIPQPIGFTWIGLLTASNGWVFPLILIPIGLAGGAIGFGLITSARWVSRWFPIWAPVYLVGAALGFYMGERSIGATILVVLVLSGLLTVINTSVQQAEALRDQSAR